MSDEQPLLLVEDNPDDVLLVRYAFKKAQVNMSMVVVENGEQAIDYLSGNGEYADRTRYPLPVLVLLDLKLPRKSGFEVLEWMRCQPGLKRLPVVVLTHSKQTPDINRAYEAGANSYLVKPTLLEELVDVSRALNLYWVLMNEKPEIS